MADSYEINLEIQGGEQPEIVMEAEGGATDGASARNAEAWANGTRNGVPVTEGDPAYHNNSKYYRDSAAAIVSGDIIDDDAGIGDHNLTWSADKLVGEFEGKATAIGVTDTESAAVKTLTDGADGLPMALTVGIEPVQAGSGDPSPSNVRAISGWDEVKISRTGGNLFSASIESGAIDSSDGTTSSNNKRLRFNDYVLLKAGSYTISCAEEYQVAPILYNIKKQFVTPYGSTPGNIVFGNCPSTITLTEDYYVKCVFKKSDNAVISTTDISKVQINIGTTAEAYEAFTGQTYEITIPSTPGTVYGGSLTVNKDGTGKLSVSDILYTIDGTRVMDFGTGSGIENRVKTTVFFSQTSIKIGLIKNCNSYPIVTTSPTVGNIGVRFNTNGYIYIFNGSFTSLETAQSMLNETPVEVIIEKVTPDEYTLTASQVNALITSLKGVSNLYADSGNILSVDYSADTKLYVDGKISEGMKLIALLLTANHEGSMKASKAYASGDLLTVGNTLYKATTSIANGATLTEGTNVTETTIAQELAALA